MRKSDEDKFAQCQEPTMKAITTQTSPTRTRRDLLRQGLATGTLLSFGKRVLGANDRVRLALIGCGIRGMFMGAKTLLCPNTELVAACDVFQEHLEACATLAPRAEKVRDHRRLLDRKDIDAVIVATPDHWHAPMTIDCCNAGKDVYVEKPLSRTLEEGRAMVVAARKKERIVQVGLQHRSAEHFQRAREIVRSGKLGRIGVLRCRFNKHTGMTRPAGGQCPAGLDWKAFLGSAPYREYDGRRHYDWRYFWDYSGGMLTDDGTHVIDMAHLLLDLDAPEEISQVGGIYVNQDGRETPDTIEVTYRYANCLVTFEHLSYTARDLNVEAVGPGGSMKIDRTFFEVKADLNKDIGEKGSTEDIDRKHMANFLECVRSRKIPNCDVEIGHRATSAAILGNVSLKLGKKIGWNGNTETLREV
jgi:predicted dehydrogenase